MQLSLGFYIIWSFEGNYKTTLCNMNCSLIKLASRQPQCWFWISCIFSNSPNTTVFLSALLISCVSCQLKLFIFFNMTQCWNKLFHRKNSARSPLKNDETSVMLVKITIRNKMRALYGHRIKLQGKLTCSALLKYHF